MSEEKIYFEISETGNFIQIELLSLNFPDSELDWDRNWIAGIVTVRAGNFSGKFSADFMTQDFVDFKEQLIELYKNLTGTATFETIESQVEINIAGDGIGHLRADCVVMDSVGIGNKLEFEINFDQTHIPKILNQLDKITNTFPRKVK